MNTRLHARLRRSMSFVCLALLASLVAASSSLGQEATIQDNEVFDGGEVPLAALSGKRIDKDWFRYFNDRFGLAIDIPTRGYRYVIPANGSGVAVISADATIHITIYAHFTVNNLSFIEDSDDRDIKKTAAVINRIYDREVAETLAAESTITYRVKKKDFYVLAGDFKDKAGEDMIYYERFTISPRCPLVSSTFRLTYPKAKERELSKFVTRLSHSLRSTCQGVDSLPGNR